MSVFPDGHMEAGDFLNGYAGSCPGAEGWRDYLKFWIVGKYVRQYGVDAWYLDSFPVTMFAAARVCFSPHHGDGRPHGVGPELLKLARMLRESSEETVSLAITCESVNDLFMSTNSHALGLELIDGITCYPKPEIFTYTFPHYPIFSGSCNGAGSGLKYYYDSLAEANKRCDTLNRVFLMGYRFDILGHKLNRENPDMRYLRDLIALRQRIKGELYASSFQDEEGLGELPSGVYAKVFRHDRLESLSIVFLDRRTTKQSMILTIDTARLKLPSMRAAMLYALDGSQAEVELESREDGILLVRIPARMEEPAALLLRR